MEKRINLLEDYACISETLIDRLSKKMSNIISYDRCLEMLTSQRNAARKLIKDMKNIKGGKTRRNALIQQSVDLAHQNIEDAATLKFLMATEFDLLCLVDNKKVRMSFQKGKDKKVIGIFPFINSSLYLEVEESEMTQRCKVDNDYIPPIYMWEDIFRMIFTINEHLKLLQLPILEGLYFAKQANSSNNDNLIIKIDQDEKQLKFGSFSSEEPAKVRYFKIHQSKEILSLM